MQINLEDIFFEMAERESKETQKPSVVICDRGLFDGKAWVPPEIWNEIVDYYGWNGVTFIEERYDAVIHLVTAAEEATREQYNFSNAARYETPD